MEGDVQKCRELLLAGADPAEAQNDKKVALHLAAGRGFDEIVGLLLEFKADVHCRDKFGGNAVDEASYWYMKGRSHEEYAAVSDGCSRVLTLLAAAGGRASSEGDPGFDDRRRQYIGLQRATDRETRMPVQFPWQQLPELQALTDGSDEFHGNGVAPKPPPPLPKPPPAKAPPSPPPPKPPPAKAPPAPPVRKHGWQLYTDPKSLREFWLNEDTGEAGWA